MADWEYLDKELDRLLGIAEEVSADIPPGKIDILQEKIEGIESALGRAVNAALTDRV